MRGDRPRHHRAVGRAHRRRLGKKDGAADGDARGAGHRGLRGRDRGGGAGEVLPPPRGAHRARQRRDTPSLSPSRSSTCRTSSRCTTPSRPSSSDAPCEPTVEPSPSGGESTSGVSTFRGGRCGLCRDTHRREAICLSEGVYEYIGIFKVQSVYVDPRLWLQERRERAQTSTQTRSERHRAHGVSRSVCARTRLCLCCAARV